jgi:cell division protein FtsL
MLMKTLPPRITMHLRPAVRRLTILWIAAVVLAATMTISASYHARLVTSTCWLALAGLSVYALQVLKHLRP